MAGQISTIKKRLQNVVSTKKLTNATELVATVKLQKYNTKTKQNEEYAKNLKHFIMAVLQSESSDVENNPFLKKPYAENPLYIVITSNSGRNAMPIEMAMRCQKEGVYVVAMTNLEQPFQLSRRGSHKRRFPQQSAGRSCRDRKWHTSV